ISPSRSFPFRPFFYILSVLTPAWSQMCPRRCQCPQDIPVCPPGVPVVLDDCACCLVCASQTGQVCSEMNPCDVRKGLQCDYSVNVHRRTGVCVFSVGNVCVLDGSVYQNGQIFFPSCKYQCICRDGQIGCVPRCNLDVMLPGPDCPMPHKVQVPGECCEKWVCEPQTESSALAFRQEETVSFNGWDPSLNCVEQTTEWGACSQTCGMGVSTRVTNKNDRCEMVKQSRLCVVRPCDIHEYTKIATSHDLFPCPNCTSVQAYKPRYCGSCMDGRCCTPHRTKTSLVEFQCTNGKTTRKPVMAILTCACHSHCPRDNAVWDPSELAYRTSDKMMGDFTVA
uniref:CCN family member 3 n=1 Tax=Kryptolebias marmoratus TaxID=37003 RepID=A0A3Q3BKM5_KRYMA